MIYFARAGNDGLVKIGWSRLPRVIGRITQIQPIVPFEIEVIRTLDAPAWVEHWLHAQFVDQRVVGEWFIYHPDMLTIMPPDEKPLSAHSRAWHHPKAEPGRGVRLMVLLPEELLAEIDEYRFTNRIKYRADAIRRLIRDGLTLYRRGEGETATGEQEAEMAVLREEYGG